MRARELSMRAVAVAALLGGCSAVLPPPRSDVPCAIPEGGTDPCAERGLVCTGGFCRLPEVCNGIDDDLDGQVDEGFDADDDGYTYCGGMTPELADCDDTNDQIHPGDPAAPEICDGRDNQCDGIDVDVVACPVAGEVCSRTLGTCVTPVCSLPEFQCGVGSQCVDNECRPGDCTAMGCTEGVCDPVTHTCVIPQMLGAACTNDAECISQRCLPVRSALGVTSGVSATTRSVCTTACCTDADCPSDYLCWAPGTGVHACVQRSLIASGPLGEPDPTTERACTRPQDCSGQGCVLSRYDAHDRTRSGFLCASAGSDSDSCQSNGDCSSGVCLFGHVYWALGDVYNGPCSSACRTNADCGGLASAYNGSLDHAWSGDDDVVMGCGTARAIDTSDWVQLCLESSGGGAGASCRSDADCLDRACVAGTCRSTCCNDGHCGTPDVCRPIERGDHWEMLCAPPLAML